ncbi:hypothetical protein AO1008_08270 [Aspergillus oryzae 100-8]|uniref:Uncharacterized protein n=1 Tax=Aspergillus oryzae (strain 3.042) TaxID=1160506 RepID=I7ZU64_ASPO3|nr:hypothetical protein Ao3042_08399 [Aspergillus oryzae 3.042]KDE81983.1 hypothetical protein AO1008_08270 [Aspergillus oryzae 100-8]|eukprot:EIT75487.1 hypothetical protein Ao3042_08399 [Aspergillus oryzae 3.042]
MKLTRYLSLLTLVLTANAADCTAPNQQWFSDAAVQMMWSIRAWLCPNAWSQSITAGPDGGWCDAGGGVISAYWGSWTISGMQSEQQCWQGADMIGGFNMEYAPIIHLLCLIGGVSNTNS